MRDAVIIGAGHNGLVAAAYLAGAGLDVEVLARREIVGGACVTEELWPGVRASPGAYTLSLLRGEIFRDLDLPARGLEVAVHEPYLFAPFPDGRRVVTWSSRERTHAQLAADWSRADADAYAAWSSRWDQAAARARPLMLEPPDRERWLAAVGPEILDGAIADDLAGIPSEPVRVPFALQGLIGTLAGPYDAGTAFVAFYHELGEAAGPPGAWGYARGGMGAVTGALRAPARPPSARSSRRRARPRSTRRWRPRVATSSRCSPRPSRPTSTPTPPPTPPSRASPRPARTSQTASPTASRSARGSSRPASASPVGTSSTARCFRGRCSRTGLVRAASAGSRGCISPARAPTRVAR